MAVARDPAGGFVDLTAADSSLDLPVNIGPDRAGEVTSGMRIRPGGCGCGEVLAPAGTLRATAPDGFLGAACVETQDTDTQAVASQTPAAGRVFYYLIRAGNSCGGRQARSCL